MGTRHASSHGIEPCCVELVPRFELLTRLACVVALHIKATGPAVVLVFIAFDWMLRIGSLSWVASARVVVAVVVWCVVLLIHLDGL